MVYIYILKLKDDNWYVGKTDNPKFRLDNHFKSNGSNWTKKFKPLNIHQLIPDCDAYDEDKFTVKYMAKYGIENVRGGSFCESKLSGENKNTIEKMISASGDQCFVCNQTGHFANRCPNKITKSKYYSKNLEFLSLSEGYESADEIELESDDDVNDNSDQKISWCCNYCNKEFKTKKGATYHENKYCKIKKQSKESDEGEDISPDNLEQEFAESDKDDGMYELGGKKYLWYDEELYEESNNKTPKSLLKSFRLNASYGYEDYNWNSIHAKTNKKAKKAKCNRCGRSSHYSSNCYAKKHVKGYCL